MEAGLSESRWCEKAELRLKGGALPRVVKDTQGWSQGDLQILESQLGIYSFFLLGFEPETYWDRMHLFQEAIAHRFVP